MIQLTSETEMIGKTIASCHQYNQYNAIVFTDTTFILQKAVSGWGDADSNSIEIDDDKIAEIGSYYDKYWLSFLIEIGLLTKDEVEKEIEKRRTLDKENQKNNEIRFLKELRIKYPEI